MRCRPTSARRIFRADRRTIGATVQLARGVGIRKDELGCPATHGSLSRSSDDREFHCRLLRSTDSRRRAALLRGPSHEGPGSADQTVVGRDRSLHFDQKPAGTRSGRLSSLIGSQVTPRAGDRHTAGGKAAPVLLRPLRDADPGTPFDARDAVPGVFEKEHISKQIHPILAK